MARIGWKYDYRKYCTKLEVRPKDSIEENEIKKWILTRKLEEPKNSIHGDRRHTFTYATKNNYGFCWFELFFRYEEEATAFKIQWQS